MTADHELTEALRDRAAAAHLRTASFDEVRGAARRIRRRRQLVVGVAAAAVLAVAVPTALDLGRPSALRSTPADSPTATPSPSQSPTPTPTATATPTQTPSASEPVDTGPFTSLGLARGEGPRIAFVDQGTLRDAAGAQVAAPSADYQSVVAIGSRWYAVRSTDGDRSIVVLDAAGTELRTSPLGSGPVVSADGSLVAWSTPADEVLVDWDGTDGPRTVDTGAGAGVQVVAVSGAAPCPDDAACRVFVNDEQGPVGLPDLDAELLSAVSPTGDLAARISTDDEGNTCSGVFTAQGQQVWTTCEHRLFGFAPDGSHLLAGPAYASGLGDPEVSVLAAATGEVVRSWTAASDGTGPVLVTTVWEDDTHALTAAFEDQSWTVVRLGLDGSTEAATDTVPGDDTTFPFGLGAR